MTNADKIRQMNDEQLARFLWIWKINSVTTFLTQGGMNSMDAKDMREWVGQTTETFVCTETFVGDDYIFDQDFNDKADRKTEPQTSKIIEAYTKGFEDGAEAVKAMPQTERSE